MAYAPHRAIDVDAWDVDWYVYSTYKVFGPHMAVLYGRDDALAELPGPNHDFIPRDDLPYQFEPGGANHEGCAGLLALGGYLKLLAGAGPEAACDRAVVEAAFARAAALEQPLTARLLAYLDGKPGVRVIGSPVADDARVGTVSFRHERLIGARDHGRRRRTRGRHPLRAHVRLPAVPGAGHPGRRRRGARELRALQHAGRDRAAHSRARARHLTLRPVGGSGEFHVIRGASQVTNRERSLPLHVATQRSISIAGQRAFTASTPASVTFVSPRSSLVRP